MFASRGGGIVLEGAAPLLTVRGDLRSYNKTGTGGGGYVEFRVPRAGYARTPLVMTGTGSGQTFCGDKKVATNSKPIEVRIAADSPLYGATGKAVTTDAEGRKVKSEGVFKVVPVRKGQVFVDQDGGLIADGKPWFPFGMYHVLTTNDVDGIADLGIDLCQMWRNSVERPGMIEKLRERNARLCGDDTTGRYLIAVNGSDDPVDAVFRHDALKGLKLEPLFDTPAAQPDKGGRMKVAFKGAARAAWRVAAP